MQDRGFFLLNHYKQNRKQKCKLNSKQNKINFTWHQKMTVLKHVITSDGHNGEQIIMVQEFHAYPTKKK